MSITRLTPDSHIDNYITNLVQRKEQVIIRNLCYVGEKCLNEARTNGGYYDQTGNLRSSIGYVVVVDGNVIQMSSFSTVKQGKQGASDGQEFVKQLISKFPKGICLIVVAGMNYASYVSAKGYNVLDSSELLAEKLVPQMLSKLGFRRK
ncbi:MAG: hypothetical protein LBO74_08525 [Candidatus Symbiothrix sp.]|nr:hypothetical protein [Candidatus Symbiothrix sp.]